ncbi:MAG: hypothetical protein V3W22_02920 [Thermoplasmata archaeon]
MWTSKDLWRTYHEEEDLQLLEDDRVLSEEEVSGYAPLAVR